MGGLGGPHFLHGVLEQNLKKWRNDVKDKDKGDDGDYDKDDGIDEKRHQRCTNSVPYVILQLLEEPFSHPSLSLECPRFHGHFFGVMMSH